MGFKAGDVNLYRFVGNSPINMVDPTGLAGEVIFGTTKEPGIARVTTEAANNRKKVSTISDKDGTVLEIWVLGGAFTGRCPNNNNPFGFGKCLPDRGINQWMSEKDEDGKLKKLFWYNIGPNATTNAERARIDGAIVDEFDKQKKGLKRATDPIEKFDAAWLAAFLATKTDLAKLPANDPRQIRDHKAFETVVYILTMTPTGPKTEVLRLYEDKDGKLVWKSDGRTPVGADLTVFPR